VISERVRVWLSANKHPTTGDSLIKYVSNTEKKHVLWERGFRAGANEGLEPDFSITDSLESLHGSLSMNYRSRPISSY